MSERKWKIGDDMSTYDAILDMVTFDDIILAVKCNCPAIDKKAIMKTAREIIDERMEDFFFLVLNNIDEIKAAALKMRNGGSD